MAVRGLAPTTTWAEIGLHRLTVRAFEKALRGSGFETEHLEYRITRLLRPLRRAPLLRELFISEVVGVFAKRA
jgi:hypothetical protein